VGQLLLQGRGVLTHQRQLHKGQKRAGGGALSAIKHVSLAHTSQTHPSSPGCHQVISSTLP
jgi:hypothetical protein